MFEEWFIQNDEMTPGSDQVGVPKSNRYHTTIHYTRYIERTNGLLIFIPGHFQIRRLVKSALGARCTISVDHR